MLLAASSTTMLEIGEEPERRSWWERKGPQPIDQLRTFLRETMEPASAVLVAGVLPSTQDDGMRFLEGDPTASPLSREQIREMMLVVAADVSTAPTTLGPDIVAFARARPQSSYRVHYNLACYLSGLLPESDERLEPRAIQELATALQTAPPSERRRLVSWAPDDPSLDELRERGRQDFENVLSIYSDPSLRRRRENRPGSHAQG